MKISAYVILQAEKLIFKGIKGSGNDDGKAYLYSDEETARDFLRKLIVQIKHEQSIGWRTKDNLIPDQSLDFLIEKVEIEIPEENINKRKWKIDQAP